MNQNLLTAGQFARLASTTKRTVTWYDQEGLLKPSLTSQAGYRMYKPEQIIDFLGLLLLRKLNFSINEIKEFRTKKKSGEGLFHLKRKSILAEINKLKRKLGTIDTYYHNFDREGIFVKPTIKKVAGIKIYYLQKEGPYSKIYEYGLELKSYFKKLPKRATFITVFEEAEYKPLKSRFKVGVVIARGMELKKMFTSVVLKTSLPPYTALSYTHKGSPSLLSFLWKQLEKYASKHGMKQDYNLPFTDIEIYKHTGLNKMVDEDEMVIEMNLPIK